MTYNRQKEVALPLTIDTNAYSANDVVGGLMTIPIANAGGGALLRWLRVVDDDNEKAELAIYLFSSLPTVFLDDAAFAPTVADLKKMIGKVLVQAADYETINGNAVSVMGVGASTDYINAGSVGSDGNLYAYAVCTGTPTYTAATDLHITFGLWLDG